MKYLTWLLLSLFASPAFAMTLYVHAPSSTYHNVYITVTVHDTKACINAAENIKAEIFSENKTTNYACILEDGNIDSSGVCKETTKTIGATNILDKHTVTKVTCTNKEK